MTPRRYCAVGSCAMPASPRFCVIHTPGQMWVIHGDSSSDSAGQGPEIAHESPNAIHADETAGQSTDSQLPLLRRGESRDSPPLRRRSATTRREVANLRAVGLWSGHCWSVCAECGEGCLVPRAGDAKRCFLTPRCKGRLAKERTPTPLQAAQMCLSGIFACVGAAVGHAKPIKVPKPRKPTPPKENP